MVLGKRRFSTHRHFVDINEWKILLWKCVLIDCIIDIILFSTWHFIYNHRDKIFWCVYAKNRFFDSEWSLRNFRLIAIIIDVDSLLRMNSIRFLNKFFSRISSILIRGYFYAAILTSNFLHFFFFSLSDNEYTCVPWTGNMINFKRLNIISIHRFSNILNNFHWQVFLHIFNFPFKYSCLLSCIYLYKYLKNWPRIWSVVYSQFLYFMVWFSEILSM